MQRIELVTPEGKRKTAGYLRGEIFYKRVREGDHLYRLLDAWGIDERVFEQVVAHCREIRILEETNGKIYSCHPRLWQQRGVVKEHKPHGRQLFLARSYFTVTDKAEKDRLRNALEKRKQHPNPKKKKE